MEDEYYLENFSRQLILKEIGPKGQEKINSSSVIVIGLGGLGSSVLQFLSVSGMCPSNEFRTICRMILCNLLNQQLE